MGFTPIVMAVHLDVEIWGEEDALFAGFCRTPGDIGCDLEGFIDGFDFPEGQLPVEATSGKMIFLADFQDFTGGPYKTLNPGFQSIQNALLPNELISYRGLGHLRFWEPESSSWGQAPDTVRISLYGGLEASGSLATDYEQCAGQLLCFDAQNFTVDKFTVFAGEGILGNPELVVDITNQAGILHTHLSFFLENPQGETTGPVGAYLIEMQVFSNARSTPSQPFLVLFNAGLDSEQYAQALSQLIGDVSDNPDTTTLPENPTIPTSILGDVDLDGDVDRIDVALILLAAQNNDALQADNLRFDTNFDGQISRQDAEVAKGLCSLRLCQSPSALQAEPIDQVALFNSYSGQLTLNDVQVEEQHYKVVLQQSGESQFTLKSADATDLLYVLPARYEANSGVLDVPALNIDGRFYEATLQNIGGFTFRLENIQAINNLIRHSK